jgi:hypothetical protein
MSVVTPDECTPLAPEDDALLELARGGFRASPEDRARIRGKVALQVGAGIGASTLAASKAAAAAPGAVSGAAVPSLLVAKIAATTALVTGLAGAGAVLLHRSLATEGAPLNAPLTGTVSAAEGMARAPAPAAPLEAPVPRETPAPLASLEVPVERPAPPHRALADHPPHHVAPSPVTTAPDAPPPPGPSIVAPSSVMTARPPLLDEAAPPSRAPRGPATVDVEAALLRDADAALLAGHPSRALALVEEHASRFPGGVLVEEREAERIVVLCALGRAEEARARGAEFVRAAPRSPQLSRIRRACGERN